MLMISSGLWMDQAPVSSRARRWQGTWYPQRGGSLSQFELRWSDGQQFPLSDPDSRNPWCQAMGGRG